jgi:uncharacterized phage protein (TIGR01671 family)
MRTIKFRIWSKSDKQWIENRDEFGIHYINGLFTCDDNYIFQQFIGRTDEKNKEVYEGDIVRYYPLPPFEVSTGIIGEIVFSQGSFAIRVTDRFRGAFKRYNVYFNGDNDGDIDYFEVIGNVCESPELLK